MILIQSILSPHFVLSSTTPLPQHFSPLRHQFQKAAKLLRKHPETMVIIDHLGSPLMEDLQEKADQRLGDLLGDVEVQIQTYESVQLDSWFFFGSWSGLWLWESGFKKFG